MLIETRVYLFAFSFRYNLFTGCPQAKTCTLILRGGAEQFIEETERSLHDAIMIVRRALKNYAVVAGKCLFLFVWSHQINAKVFFILIFFGELKTWILVKVDQWSQLFLSHVFFLKIELLMQLKIWRDFPCLLVLCQTFTVGLTFGYTYLVLSD